MEKIVEQGRLYDFYGELLTPHQRKVYEEAVYEDLTVTEIAQEAGVSRQGVHDLISRVTKTLQGYEDRLHMVARFDALSERVREIKDVARRAEEAGDEETARRLDAIAASILEDLA